MQFIRVKQWDNIVLTDVLRFLQTHESSKPIRDRNYATWQEKLLTYKSDPDYFEKLSSAQFEQCIQSWFQWKGWNVAEKESELGYDFAVDGFDKYNKVFVETKKYNKNSMITVGHVQGLLGVLYAYRGDHGILITTSDFSRSAIDFAERTEPKIELWHITKIIEDLERGVNFRPTTS